MHQFSVITTYGMAHVKSDADIDGIQMACSLLLLLLLFFDLITGNTSEHAPV